MNMNTFTKEKAADYLAYGIILAGLVGLVICMWMGQGTGDDGDSVHHYLIARYAFKHPENFFDHWGKPVFTLLAAPFAQGGWIGMKSFNILCIGISLFFSYRIAKHLEIANAWLVPFIILTAPFTWTLTLSGLTEPLFSFWLSVSVFLMMKDKDNWGTCMISFLPFIRSEGLIIFCVWILYLLFSKKYASLPMLIIGHVVYGFAGWISGLYSTPLWVFSKIPYAHKMVEYGSGTWSHFIENMPSAIGWCWTVLLFSGLLYGAFRLIQHFRTSSTFTVGEIWLIYGIFTAFFVAHSLFWTFGIFNSFGMMRVMIGVFPMIAIICLRWVNAILAFIDKKNSFLPPTLLVVMVALGVWFLQQEVHRGLFQLSGGQFAQNKMADDYKEKWKSQIGKVDFYYRAPYVADALGFDFFDSTMHKFSDNLAWEQNVKPNSILIWDDHYAAFEGRLHLTEVLKDPRFHQIASYYDVDNTFGHTANTRIFLINPTHRDTVAKTAFFFQDYEHLPATPPVANLCLDRFFSGKQAIKLDGANPYSPGLDTALQSLTSGKPTRIAVSLQTSMDVVSYLKSQSAVIVVYVEENGQSLYWKGYNLSDFIIEPQKWATVEIEDEIPAIASPQAKVKIFVWNNSPNTVWIDDFKVSKITP